ncbi:MAG: nucleoside triphosphate pyrophosphatase [Patescibacteria group bacterium]
MNQKIILASTSLSRKELLQKIGLKFQAEDSGYEENMKENLPPHALAKKLSRGKAEVVAKRHKNAIIIAADTIVVLGKEVMGKPHSAKGAKEMLKKLSGKSHSIITGFTIINAKTGKIISQSIETKVHMKKLSPQIIATYVNSKEPLDKAGAYAIQGLGSILIDKIEGDYSNIVGLPLAPLVVALKKFGVKVL